ncbi:MAG: hypothetical protein WED09_11925 [Homoserinimonas sp.]
MAKGIEIGIASETKAFKQGIDTGIIEPLEDAEKALKDLGQDRSLDKLEDGLEDAQKASKKLEREVKDTADTIESEFKKSYAKMKNSAEDGADGHARSMDDMRREANSTAKESAASFDGSAESIVDAFQEVAANAFEGFGPAGAVAGLAAAAGIGLVSAAFTRAGEDAEALAEKTAEAFDQMIQSQGKYIGQEFIQSNLQDLLNDTEKVAEATKIAADLGADLATVQRAMAGDAQALADVQSNAARMASELGKSIEEQKDATGRASVEDLKRLESLDKISGKFESQAGVYAEAGRRWEAYQKASTDSAFANDVNLKSVAKLTDGVDKLGSGLSRVPKNTNPKVNVQYNIDDRKLQAALKKTYTIDIRGVYRDRQGRRLNI